MLTIKIIQDGVTSITESNSFVFYDETSREFEEMTRLAEKRDLSHLTASTTLNQSMETKSVKRLSVRNQSTARQETIQHQSLV